MAENKTRPTTTNVRTFLDACPDDARRKDALALARMMQQATGKEPAMWGTAIVGFDSVHYKYESGREGDMPLVSFALRKAATVLYGLIGFDGAEVLLAQLGRHTTGKGCLYIRKLDDVDGNILEKLLERAVAASRKQQSKA